MRWYLVALVPTALVNLAGMACPLTVWEKHFWRLAGETPYRGGFISHYFVEPFHAPGLRPGDETLLLVFVVVWCLSWLLYAAVGEHGSRQAGRTLDDAQPEAHKQNPPVDQHHSTLALHLRRADGLNTEPRERP